MNRLTKMKEYINPEIFIEKIQSEFNLRDATITKIHHDDYFGGSWMINFEMDGKKYQFTWDNREMWLSLEIQGKNKKHRKDWDDVDIFRLHLSAKTKKEEKMKEATIIKQIVLMLHKLKPIH